MKLHWISPYRSDKNIGAAINEAIMDVRYCPGDWICLTDHDVLFLLPDSKAQIERILLSETEFDVLGCMTNRIRSKEQLIQGFFNNDDCIRNHIQIADLLQSDAVIPARGVMAAFMLCFRVSVWEKVGGFAEGVINFDTLFNSACRNAGFKIGLMKGVYVWHSYRIMSKVPLQDCTHLINK